MHAMPIKPQFLLIFLFIAPFLACQSRNTSQSPRPGHVEVVDAVTLKRSLRFRQWQGEATLAIGKSVTIKSPISAPLSDQFIAAPQAVDADQDIFTFDLREVELKLAAKRSELKTLQTQLEETPTSPQPSPEEAPPSEPTAEDDDSEMEVPTAIQPAASALPPSEAVTTTKVDQLQNEISLLEYQSEQARLTAPFSGTLMPLQTFYAGQPIREGDALYRLVVTHPMAARVLIPLEHAAYIEVGMPLSFIPYSNPEQRMAGTIDTLSPYTDNRDVFEAIVHIDNPIGSLKEGQKGEIRLPTKRQDQVLALPKSAIIMPEARPELKSDSPMVFVIRDDQLSLQPVKLGQHYGNDVEIKDGIDEGDLVANSNLAFLFDGEQVRVKAEIPAPSAPTAPVVTEPTP